MRTKLLIIYCGCCYSLDLFLMYVLAGVPTDRSFQSFEIQDKKYLLRLAHCKMFLCFLVFPSLFTFLQVYLTPFRVLLVCLVLRESYPALLRVGYSQFCTQESLLDGSGDHMGCWESNLYQPCARSYYTISLAPKADYHSRSC